MNWSQITDMRSDLSRTGADLTYRISYHQLPPSNSSLYFQVMRCKALRAPHDSAMVSCSLYLSSQKKQRKKKVPNRAWFPKSDLFLQNPVEPLWGDWEGQVPASSQQCLGKLIKKRIRPWSNETDATRAENDGSEPASAVNMHFQRRSRNRNDLKTSLKCHLIQQNPA